MQSLAQIQNIVVVPSKHQVTVHPQTGKKEYIFVDLAAVYPTPEEPGTEISFEEIMATNRGWLDCTWEDRLLETSNYDVPMQLDEIEEISQLAIHRDTVMHDENGAVMDHSNMPKPSKKKHVEVNETQISKLNDLALFVLMLTIL